MRKKIFYFFLFILLLAIVGSLVSKNIRRFFTLYANGESFVIVESNAKSLPSEAAGAYYFLGGSFGALSTDTLRGSATPWMLTASALTLDYVDGDLGKVNWASTRSAFLQWGFTSPTHIANWPQDLPLQRREAPLGLAIGSVKRNLPSIEITAANLSCTACHVSVSYTNNGTPDLDTVWLGMSNSSMNLESYPQAIYDAFDRFGDGEKLMQAAAILFPDMSKTEKFTLEKLILPSAVKRIAELKATIGRAVPFKGGYPGATNGLDSLHVRLGLQDKGVMPAQSAFNSIPNLDGHVFRTSFLNTGNYEIPDIDVGKNISIDDVTKEHLDKLGAIVAFFTVPSMGVDLETAQDHVGQAQAVMQFLANTKTQPFPGNIDETRALAGRKVFKRDCAACHGNYDTADNLISFPNYIGKIGTDTVRMDILIEAGTADAVNQSIMGKYIRSVEPRGYSAPVLNGVWSSAPYLHNGSVPTLWHLFNPETRPEKFYVGGQRLSFDKLGIDGSLNNEGIWVYPQNYTPWTKSVLFDTTKTGLSNAGHDSPFDTLSLDEKQALLEYLKKL